MAQMYFMLDEDEKAVAIMTDVANTCMEYLQFADSLKRRHRSLMTETSRRQLAILGYVLQVMEHNGQNEFVDQYYDDYIAYDAKYNR